MQAGDAGTHNDAAGQSINQTHFLAAHHKQRDRGREDRRQECSQNCRPVVLDGHRQVEGQHPLHVHRPDADA